MKESVYTAYEDLPLFLNAETVAKLPVSPSQSSYELMHEKRISVVTYRLTAHRTERKKFRAWVEEKDGRQHLKFTRYPKRDAIRIIFLCRMKFSAWVSAPVRSQCMRIWCTARTGKHFSAIRATKRLATLSAWAKTPSKICRQPDWKAVNYCRADFRHHPKRRKAQRKFALYNTPDCGSGRAVLRATTDTATRRKSASGSFEKARRIWPQTREIGGLRAVLRLVRKQAGESEVAMLSPQDTADGNAHRIRGLYGFCNPVTKPQFRVARILTSLI